MADPLTRRYRRLLLAYPRDYRRSRGDELLGSLLDAARPGRARPTVRETVDLIRHGLRCRLGRPTSRSVVTWATLTAVICGMFTAALATWAAWHTSRPLPDRAEAAAILSTTLPDHTITDIYRPPALFAASGHPFGTLSLDEPPQYDRRVDTVVLNGAPPVEQTHTLSTAQQRLSDAGWRVDAPLTRGYREDWRPVEPGAPLGADTSLVARRGDTVIRLRLYDVSDAPKEFRDSTTYLDVEIYRTAPAAVYPAGILGGLFGAGAAWLLFGWVSRRTDGRHRARAALTTLLGTTLFMWWAPVLYSAPLLALGASWRPHEKALPLWDWIGQPWFSLLFLVGCASALLSLALATLPHRDRNPLRTTMPGTTARPRKVDGQR